MSNLHSLLESFKANISATGVTIVAAEELARDHFPRLDTDRPALVLDVSDSDLGAVQRTLRVNYPAAHMVTLTQEGTSRTIALEKLGEERFVGDAALLVPALARQGSPQTLANIMARLRAPDGCPWDIEQTHASITRALVEEAYEVLEAIAENDIPQLREELGDLQLHVLFQTQIARDQNEFALSDVGAELAEKLIRRHPHVFGTVEANDAGTVIANWETIKAEEKADKGKSNGEALDTGIPRDLPALTRAQKVSERARRRGQDLQAVMARSRGRSKWQRARRRRMY